MTKLSPFVLLRVMMDKCMKLEGNPLRQVYCDDALGWLQSYQPLDHSSMVASMPDLSEFELSLEEWKKWFIETAKLILTKTPDLGVTLFFQSDIKIDGVWIDKAYLCQKAAEELGHAQIFHKIFCRVPPGMATKGRPSYSHLLCFSKNFRMDVGKSTPDVVASLGEKTWARGMGAEVSLSIAKFLAKEVNCSTVVNPFCGEGSMLAAANVYGLKAIGIERSTKRAQKALLLSLNQEKEWQT